VNSHNVVDSSGWLEYFADTNRAAFFAPAIEDSERLIVPVLCIYEVFKKVLRERGEDSAMQVASMMQIGTVVDLDWTLAMEAARYPLPLADSIIYSTAVRARAVLWTQDEHFKDFPDVRFLGKSTPQAAP
jgi:predicted nucleic acid-binding protein